MWKNNLPSIPLEDDPVLSSDDIQESPFQAESLVVPSIKTTSGFIVSYDKVNETNFIHKILEFTGSGFPLPVATTSVASRKQISEMPNFPFNHDKKIIEFGSDAPAATWVKDNVASMEKKPFDGVAFIPGSEYADIWQPDAWRNNPKYVDNDSLSAIKWNKFNGNNFLLLFCNKEDLYNLDYWNNSSWNEIEANMIALAKAAHDHGCAGILFDQEYYGTASPWSYSEMSNDHTLADTQAQIRKRGGQVMKAWQSQYPDITILYTDLTTDDTNYDLLPYWVNGMLDVIGPDARLVEGDENAYYFTHTTDWFIRYGEFKISKSLVPYLDPINEDKWVKNVEVGKSLYWESVNKSGTPEEIQDRWEHNAFMGMATSDKWVWTYSNSINWWGVPDEHQPIGDLDITEIPEGAVKGIKYAKNKYSADEKLGWDLKDFNPDSSVKVNVTNTNTIEASATISFGTITGVDFYLNSVLVSHDDQVPYYPDLSSVPTGNYTLFARGRVWNKFKGESYWGTSQPVDINLFTSTQAPVFPK